MMLSKFAKTAVLTFVGMLGLLAFAPLASLPAQAPPSAPAAPTSDFTLQSITTADTFKSADAKGWYVALHFLLKTECPVCLRHTGDVLRRQDELPGVRQIFIKPDTDAEIKAWAAKLPTDLPAIYRDPDAALAKRFAIPFGYQFHGQTVHYPALILLGPDGREVFRYVGKNNSDRYSFDNLIKKINELTVDPALAQWSLPADRVVLGGHDPVSYFSEGGPKPGQPELPAYFRGVTYRFASAANRRAFAAAPQKYAPACGGWCATAMTQGNKIEADPANFKITKGSLYLFSRKGDNNALTTWMSDEAANAKAAQQKWMELSTTAK